MLMNKDDSCLLIIDVQEKLAPITENPRKVINGCANLVAVAKKLGIPTIITEQYPKGLGETIFDVKSQIDGKIKIFEKTHFSCLKDEKISKYINSMNKKQIVLAGVEAHVCVLQTAMDLKYKGWDVYVVHDASSSRKIEHEQMAYQRLYQCGVNIVNTEMVFFEWLEKGEGEDFKEISKKYIR